MVAVRVLQREIPLSFVINLFIGLAMSIVAYVFLFDAQGVSQGVKDITHVVILFISLGTAYMATERPDGFWSREHGHFHVFDESARQSAGLHGLALGTVPVWLPFIAIFAYAMCRLFWWLIIGVMGFYALMIGLCMAGMWLFLKWEGYV